MKSSETKKKCPYVERDISWMYFNQRILLELPVRKYLFWNA